jgi:beta-lactamase superfamily II metal-dependent hydrolase
MSDDERQLLNCCGCCALTFFLISVVIVLLGIMQGVKIHTFVQTRCLVKSSNMETCGVRGGSKVSLRMEQCYQPEWLIEYIDYGQKEETRIKSQYWAKYNGYDDIDQLKSLKMYQVFLLRCREYDVHLKPLLLLVL